VSVSMELGESLLFIKKLYRTEDTLKQLSQLAVGSCD